MSDVGSPYPGGGEAPKGLAVRQLKRYASWVQTVQMLNSSAHELSESERHRSSRRRYVAMRIEKLTYVGEILSEVEGQHRGNLGFDKSKLSGP